MGPIGFRMALFSGLCGALSTLLLFQLIVELGDRVFSDSQRLTLPISFASALIYGLSSALWLQSTRPEVYSLQALLGLGVAWQLTLSTRETNTQTQVFSRLLGAACLMGMGGINHHYLAAFCSLSCVYTWISGNFSDSRSPLKEIALLALVAFVPLIAYVFLPIRAAQFPYINWVNPTTLERTFDVIFARVFHASIVDQGTTDLFWNGLQGLFFFWEQTSPITLPLALVGMASLAKRSRRVFWVLLLLFGGNVLSTSLMKFDRLNPDTWGYLQLGLGLWIAFSAIGLIQIAEKVRAYLSPSATRIFHGGTVFSLFILVVAQGVTHEPRSNLRDFEATDRIEDAILRSLPPSSLHMSSFFSLFFNHWYGQVVEGRRPDVLIISQSFDAKIHGGVPYSKALLKRAGSWEAIFHAYLLEQRIPTQMLQTLAQERPIFFEAESPSPFQDRSARRGPIFQLCSPCGELEQELDPFASVLSRVEDVTPETRTLLAWHYFQNASLLIAQQHWEEASIAIARGKELSPASPQWAELKRALPLGVLP